MGQVNPIILDVRLDILCHLFGNWINGYGVMISSERLKG